MLLFSKEVSKVLSVESKMGTMVVAGCSFTSTSSEVVIFISGHLDLRTHLCSPPPSSCMQVVIHLSVLCVVCVVFLRGKAEVQCKVWVPEKGSDAFNNILVKHFTRFGSNCNHVMLKMWVSWQFFVNDHIEFPCVLEQ